MISFPKESEQITAKRTSELLSKVDAIDRNFKEEDSLISSLCGVPISEFSRQFTEPQLAKLRDKAIPLIKQEKILLRELAPELALDTDAFEIYGRPENLPYINSLQSLAYLAQHPRTIKLT